MREILTALDGLAPDLSLRAMDAVHGHDDRWNGALDVRSLAAASVGLAAASAREFTRASGRPSVEITATLPEIVAAFASVSQLRIDGQPLLGFAPCSGFFRTADGWLRTHANYPHHRARLFRALGIDHDNALAPALAHLTSRDAESHIVSEGGVAACVVSEGEWRQEAAHDPGPWLHLCPGDSNIADRHRSPRPDSHPWRPVHPHAGSVPLPLHGVRVVSLTRVIAGPTAAKFLAALGADVIRIDPPAMPELLGQHLDTDQGVRCTARDLSDPIAAHSPRWDSTAPACVSGSPTSFMWSSVRGSPPGPALDSGASTASSRRPRESPTGTAPRTAPGSGGLEHCRYRRWTTSPDTAWPRRRVGCWRRDGQGPPGCPWSAPREFCWTEEARSAAILLRTPDPDPRLLR